MILLMSSVTSLIDADVPLFPTFAWQGDDTFSAVGTTTFNITNQGTCTVIGTDPIGTATYAEPPESVDYYQNDLDVEITIESGDTFDNAPPTGRTVLGAGISFGFTVPPQTAPLSTVVTLRFRRVGEDAVRSAKEVTIQSRV